MSWRQGYGETGGGGAALTDGWQLYTTLDFAGVTPAASMTVGGKTVTMSSTTNWTGVATGLRCTGTTGTDINTSADDLLGASWQTWSWLVIWDLTNTTITAGIHTMCIVGGVVHRVQIGPTAADIFLDGASVGGAAGSITGSAIEAVALLVQDRSVRGYTSTTTDPAFADLTEQGVASQGGVSASPAEASRVLRFGTTVTGDVTLRRIRAYRRSQVLA